MVLSLLGRPTKGQLTFEIIKCVKPMLLSRMLHTLNYAMINPIVENKRKGTNVHDLVCSLARRAGELAELITVLLDIDPAVKHPDVVSLIRSTHLEDGSQLNPNFTQNLSQLNPNFTQVAPCSTGSQRKIDWRWYRRFYLLTHHFLDVGVASHSWLIRWG